MFFSNRSTKLLTLTILLVVLLGSCTVVKNYPANRPFVYSNAVTVNGLITKDEKNKIETDLVNYWDDSLKVPTISQFGIRTVIKNPNPFDSADINRSIQFMNSYLNAQGYYNGTFRDTFHIDSIGDQYRTHVQIDIDLGRKFQIDTFVYNFKDTGLQNLATGNINKSLLIKPKARFGSKTSEEKFQPYSKQLISSELDRLVTLFRTNGYYKLTRENLRAELDTTDLSLLELNLDPFDQARKIAEASVKRRINPTLNINIMQRDSLDTVTPVKYYIGDIYYYPHATLETPAEVLIAQKYKLVETQREMTSRQNYNFMRFEPLRRHTYLRRGTVFDETNFFKTVSSFGSMGPWSQADARIIERLDTVPKLDFHFILTPAPKYSFSTDFEGSRNTGTIIAGNLLGLANNITLRNRNLWKSGVQASTTLRNGIELGFCDTCDLLQTFQSSINQTFSLPKFMLPWQQRGLKRLDYYRTLVNLNAAYTERRGFFRLRSFVGSWGYEWKKKNNSWLVRFPNIELYSLDTLSGLRKAFITNPFLRTAFNTGYVVSAIGTFNRTFQSRNRPNVSNYIQVSSEWAGPFVGLIKGANRDLYQYIKADAEFRQIWKFRKTEFAYRAFGGIGYNYSTDPVIGQTLPFFKQYFAGGPNSMRAWNMRQLGLGSSLLSDTSATFRDRYGDVQLELDLEYRFPLTTISGVKIGSAVFADMGNIWNLKSNVDNPDSKLTWNRFFKDIAIGVGTGVRLDFNYFLIRLDFAYKVKDPARRENNGWVDISNIQLRNKEFLVGPPDRPVNRNNYAFQIGIGLPF